MHWPELDELEELGCRGGGGCSGGLGRNTGTPALEDEAGGGLDGRGDGIDGLGAGTPEPEDEAGGGLDGCGGGLDGLGAGTPELDDEDRGSTLVRGSNMTCLALALAFPGICLGIAGREREESALRCAKKKPSPSR